MKTLPIFFSVDDTIKFAASVRLDPQVRVLGGRIQVGSNDPRRVANGEYPTRSVDVASLAIDRFPVTNGDFM